MQRNQETDTGTFNNILPERYKNSNALDNELFLDSNYIYILTK